MLVGLTSISPIRNPEPSPSGLIPDAHCCRLTQNIMSGGPKCPYSLAFQHEYLHGWSSAALCTSALGVDGEWLAEQSMDPGMSPAKPAPSQALRPISCCAHRASKFLAQPLLKIMTQVEIPQEISSGKRTEQPTPLLSPSCHQAGCPGAASIPPPVLCILCPLCVLAGGSGPSLWAPRQMDSWKTLSRTAADSKQGLC